METKFKNFTRTERGTHSWQEISRLADCLYKILEREGTENSKTVLVKRTKRKEKI